MSLSEKNIYLKEIDKIIALKSKISSKIINVNSIKLNGNFKYQKIK